MKRKKNTISIFNIWLIIYLFSNLYSCILGVVEGKLMIEFQEFQLKSSSLIYAFLIQLFFLFLIYKIYKRYYNNSTTPLKLKNSYGYFTLFLLIAYIIFNLTYGVNIAGQDRSDIERNNLISYFFVFFNPYSLFFIISICLASERLFLLNCLFYLASTLLSGWAGGVTIVISIYFCRHNNIKISTNTIFKLTFLGLIALFISPIIFDLKWFIRFNSNDISFFTFDSVYNYLEKISSSITYILSRFQHVGHVALYIENRYTILSTYDKGLILPYWQEGLPQYALNIIFNNKLKPLGSYAVYAIFNASGTWNTNSGLAGWAVILQEKSVFFIAYIYMILIIPFRTIKKHGDSRLAMLLGVFSLKYLFHGWITAYFDLGLYIILFLLFYKSKIK